MVWYISKPLEPLPRSFRVIGSVKTGIHTPDKDGIDLVRPDRGIPTDIFILLAEESVYAIEQTILLRARFEPVVLDCVITDRGEIAVSQHPRASVGILRRFAGLDSVLDVMDSKVLPFDRPIVAEKDAASAEVVCCPPVP